jgi:hypothetical protein
MDASRGDCWIIIGAHSFVRTDFVRASVESLIRTGAACVGGPIETLGRGPVGKAIAAAMSCPFGVGNAKFRYADDVEADVDTVPFGCYHRRVWEVVGRFDETVDGADEDSYNARLIEAGGRLVLVPSIRSSYYSRQTLSALVKQYREYGAAKGTLYGRGRPLQPRHFAPAAMVLGAPMLLLAAQFSDAARWLLIALAALYVGVGAPLAVSAASRNKASSTLTFCATVLMHLSYGIGFIQGVLREYQTRMLGNPTTARSA